MPLQRVSRYGLQVLPYAQVGGRWAYRAALYILRLPLLPQLLAAIYIFRRVHEQLLAIIAGTWEPAFPPIWTAYIAFLITIPILAAAHLAWLILTALVMFAYRRIWGPKGAAKEREVERDGYMMLNNQRRSGDADEDEDGGEWGDDRMAPQTQHPARARAMKFWRRLPSIWTVWWCVQCFLCVYVLLYGRWHYYHPENPGDTRFRPALDAALADPHPKRAGYWKGEKIFITAAFHQNEGVLPYWTKTMLDVITYLGPDNVFVSIVENYSSDRSPELLRDFAAELERREVSNRVLVQDETVKKPQDMSGNARIEFLAAIRNQALEPLLAAAPGSFERVLFSNDVFVEPESVIELLATRDGDYDFACGLDFGHFGAYDMWVLRDRAGRLTAGIWPYFFDTASYEAIKRDEPVPVFSCWNGIVAFRADPVLPVSLRSNTSLSTAPLPAPPPATHPWAPRLGPSPALTPALAFRASAPGECYSSESFLLPYDFRRVMGLQGVYANPRVVTAYVWHFYAWHKWLLRQRHVRWFVERVYDGAWMQYARMIVGDAKSVWVWDGVDCHPWW